MTTKIELLDTSVLPVGDKDGPLVSDLDRVWKIELSGTRSRPTPLSQPLAFR